MKLHECEMCGKKVLMIQDHHVIPWYLSHDDSDSNIMRVCRSCHTKADIIFDNLILRGKMNVGKDTMNRASRRYSRKYRVSKTLYYIQLLKYTSYQDVLWCNIKTGNIAIIQHWHYIKRIPSIGSIINIHRRAKKASSIKGQTTLSLN